MRHFWSDQRGNIAVLFALAIVPVIGGIGAAVDYSMASAYRTDMQKALDSTALALSKLIPLEQEQLDKVAMQYFQASMGNHDLSNLTLTVTPEQGVVKLQAKGDYTPKIANILGATQFPIGASAEARWSIGKLELALALDNTGSMAGSKISAMRSAAKSLVDIIDEKDVVGGNVKIAVVPFVTAVNIKSPGAFSMNWMDTEAKALYHGANFDRTICAKSNCSGHPANHNWPGLITNGRVDHFRLYDSLGVTWAGCVEARPGDHSMNDTPPNPSDPDSLFVPYFWPDSPDNGTQAGDRARYYSNSYLNDAIDNYTLSGENTAGKIIRHQKFVGKYIGATMNGVPGNPIYGEWAKGPNRSCARPILPLTGNMNLVKSEIDAMEPWHNSGTNIPEGLAWGWRVLSPAEPFSQGVPYEDTEVLKALVLLTDGANEVYGNSDSNNPHKSHYGSYGYLYEKRIGTDIRSTAKSLWNERTTTLCERIKAQNIRVYTITFQLNDTATQDLFRNCATAPHLYYNSPSNAELQTAFEDIAHDLTSLRLSQ